MVSTLLLNANNYAGLAELFGGLLVVLALLGLVLQLWSRHIGKQFDREPKATKVPGEPKQNGAGAGLLLLIMLLAMAFAVAVFVHGA